MRMELDFVGVMIHWIIFGCK